MLFRSKDSVGINAKLLLTEQRTFQDSRDSLGLQLSDMLAAILRRALNNRLQFPGWKDFGSLLVRHRQAAPHVPLDDVAPLLSENASLAPDRLHRSTEIRHWLRQAVARLSPRAAEMFALRFFEGRDNPEIAQALGTTPASVAVTLSRTRDRIRQEFRSSMGEIK